MKALPFLIAALGATLCGGAQPDKQASSEVKMLVTLGYVSWDHDVKDGDEWWALVRTDDGCELIPTRVRVKEEEVTPGHTTKDISTEFDGEEVLALFKDLPGTTKRTVPTLFEGNLQVLPGQCIDFNHRRLGVSLYDNSSVVRGQWREAWEKFSYILVVCPSEPASDESDDRHNVLTELEFDMSRSPIFYSLSSTLPEVFWIGDLDGDDKPDLLMDMSRSEKSTKLTLYLSSAAGPGELVGLAAEQIIVYC